MVLMVADPLVTTVSAANGGTASNSTGSISISVPPGALSQDTPLSFYRSASRSISSIPLPNISQFTYAMDNQPSGTVFLTPATMQIANQLHFAPGTSIPYGVIDESLGVWTDSGQAAVVSQDGKTIAFQASHFSQGDVNYPLFITPKQKVTKPKTNNNTNQNKTPTKQKQNVRFADRQRQLRAFDRLLAPDPQAPGAGLFSGFSYSSLESKPTVVLNIQNDANELEDTVSDHLDARFKFGSGESVGAVRSHR